MFLQGDRRKGFYVVPRLCTRIGSLLKREWVLASALVCMHGAVAAYQPGYEFQGPAGAFGVFWLPSGSVSASDPVQVSSASSGSAFRANLRTGEVGVQANQQEDLNNAPGYGNAYILEYVRFASPTHEPGSFEISVDLGLHGTLLQRRVGGDYYFAQPNFGFMVNSQARVHGLAQVGLRGLGAADAATVYTFGKEGNWSEFGPTRLVGTFSVPFDTDIAVMLGIGGNGPFDFLSTGTLQWTLPQGVTVESSSGVFLSAIPEVSSSALMLAGIPLLIAARRLRQSRAAGSRSL